MDNQDLKIHLKYDYRFNGLMIQVEYKDEISQPYTYRVADVLKQMPAHEIQAALMEEYQQLGEGDIDKSRIKMLEETDWKGKTVLDVGGYDGFAAEIAHKGGAKKAIVLDSEQWRHYGWPEVQKEGVEYVKGDYMEYEVLHKDFIQPGFDCGKEKLIERPDTLIYFNILYHVWNPVAALKHLRSLIKPGGEMLLCTLFRYHPGSWAYFYDEYGCNPTDQSVFWGPSIECLERWLKNTGWEAEKVALSYDRVLYRCKATIEPLFRQSEY